MPGQASRHITIADLKADHIGPSLHAVNNEIDQAIKELPEKEKASKESSDALAASKRKLDSSGDALKKLKRKGTELMKELQQVNKEMKEREETQTEVEKEVNNARRKSLNNQREVDICKRKINSGQKAKRTLKNGREKIAELQASINAYGKEWMEEDVIRASDEVLNHLDDLKAEGRIDDAKFGEYKAEVLKAKKIMGDALWELMLIQKEADNDNQTTTIFKESLLVKYLSERKLTRKHPQCNQTLKSLRSATKQEEESPQVAMATEVCSRIMCELDCIEDTTDEELKFSQEARNVAEGLIWN